MSIRDDVITLAELMSNDPTAAEHTIVDRLVARGFDRLRAELLVAFAPLGLARAVISRLTAEPPISLSDVASIRYPSGNRTLAVRLNSIPEFEIARQLGEETFLMGAMSRKQFSAIISNSVELILISQTLDDGQSMGGGKMAAPIMLRLTEAPGFEEWYRGLESKRSQVPK